MLTIKRFTKPFSYLSFILFPIFFAYIKWKLQDYLPEVSWVFFQAAVFISAWLGGFIGGLITTIVSIGLNSYYFLEPKHSFLVNDLRAVISIATFSILSLLISIIFEKLHRTTTQLNQAHAAKLSITQSHLNMALQSANAGIWDWNIQNNTVEWTESIWQLFGLERNSRSASFELWLSIIHPDDKPQLEATLKEALEHHREFSIEWRLASPTDGKERWLMSRGQPDLTDNNNQLIYRGLVIDISERKELDATRDLQAAALNAAANAIMITDSKGSIEWVNPAFTAMTGYAKQDVIGNNFEQFIDANEQNALAVADLWQMINKRQVWQGEIVNRRKDNSIYLVEQINTPVLNAAGKVEHIIAIKQDITEQKIQEQELVKYREHLEKLVENRTLELNKACELAGHMSQVKSSFLTNMSHEIRTPMNAVLGYCYLLEQQSLGDEALSLVHKINGAGRSLLTIINDILDFSKIEAGHLEIENAPFLLSDILENQASLMSTLAKKKVLELSISPPVGINALTGDGSRLQQVLTNLLGNALKFTDKGNVQLSIEVESEHDNQVNLRFTVRDTGIGISPEQQINLFSAFTQADSSINRRFGGTGLGLSISQQLVTLMGGELKLNSVKGKGSEFWFVLPFHRTAEIQYAPSELNDLNILIVDDSRIAREALRLTAQSIGWHADTVKSGAAAITKIQECLKSDHAYDVILLDWIMPDLDGIATAQKIRTLLSNDHEHKSQTPLLLMITAYSKDDVKIQPGIEQIDDLLNKPLTPSSLYNSVAGLLKLNTTTVNLPALASCQGIPGVRVLVVDDSDINREVAQLTLVREGAVVSLANDGLEALEWLSSHAGEVDIVLMDIQMPRMNGYLTTQKIRQNPAIARLPVIALTAGAFKSLQTDALRAGMNDFIAKPFNVPRLIALIQHWTGCVTASTKITDHVTDTKVVNLEAGQITESLEQIIAKASDLPGINIQTALKTWGHLEVYQTYLTHFIEQYQKAGAEIAQLIAADQPESLVTTKSLIHKLKGGAYSLAMEAVAACCVNLEKALDNGDSVLDAANALQQALNEAQQSLIQLQSKPAYKTEPALIGTSATALELLKTRLLAALNINNPKRVEPLLFSLETLLGTEAIAPIKAQVKAFNFREAERLTQFLITNNKNGN